MRRWREVTKAGPCPACGKPGWCAWTPDDKTLRCMREGSTPPGMRKLRNDAKGGTLYVHDDGRGKGNGRAPYHPRPTATPAAPGGSVDLKKMLKRLQDKFTDERLTGLVKATGIPAAAWAKLGPGWCDAVDLRVLRAGGAGWTENRPTGAWCFPEYNGQGLLVGLSLRAPDGRKGSPAGSIGAKRGLSVPTDLHDLPDPVLIDEGASDVAACSALVLAAVGRPSNRAGAADLAEMLDGREVLVVGERDGKPGGAWPGRDGAKAVAQQLAGRWGEPVAWTLPPTGSKDIRDWLRTHPNVGGAELLTALRAEAKEVRPRRRSTADELVDMALGIYRLGVTESGEAFAVEHDGPAIALVLRGGSSSLRAILSKVFRELTGKTPNASALADTLIALEGIARDSQPEPVALRLADHDSGVVVDLGDVSGRAVVVRPDGWAVEDRSPVLFRRTALTGSLPPPADESDPGILIELRDLLNVTDDSWPLVVGWLVASCIPDIPHPVLNLGGEQGTGKSTLARFIVGLVDPSPALLRSEPRNSEAWAIAAAGSWCVVLDNISRIPGWLSDALCKAVTGDGWVRRKLYTDSDLAVLTFKRCIILTSIDAGALRGDLGDRMMLIDLVPIDESQRQTETDLEQTYRQAQPRLLAGLLSAVSRTLAALPEVTLTTMPRMADFACVLAALDEACPELTGGRALELFTAQRSRIADDVVDADPVAAAVVRLVDESGEWFGTSSDLLEAITPRTADGKTRPPRGWPDTPRGMAVQIRRVIPALRELGIDVTIPTKRTQNGRIIRLEKRSAEPSLPSLPSPGLESPVNGDQEPVTVEDPPSPTGSQSSPPPTSLDTARTPSGDGGDGSDGTASQSSDRRRLIL